MTGVGPVKAILRTLTIEELNVVRGVLCPQVERYDGDKANYINRLRRSIKNRDVGYDELLDVVADPEAYRQVPTRIRHRIENVQFSYNASHGNANGLREEPLTSELFQALRYKFADDWQYKVFDEYRFGRYRPDLCVKRTRANEFYLIEVKIHGSMGSLLNKLSSYSKNIHHERMFVCYITTSDKRLPKNTSTVANALTDAEDNYGAEVLVKGPESFRDAP